MNINETKWRQQTSPLERLPAEQKAEYTRSLESELSTLYWEYRDALPNKNQGKLDKIERRLRWINRIAYANAKDRENNIELSTRNFQFPQRKTLSPLYLKCLILIVGVTYFVFKNAYWRSYNGS